jgi:hypothetical protein
MRNLTKTLVPNKNGKCPLPADPTLFFWLRQDLPLSTAFDQVLETQLSRYDKFFLLNVLDFALNFIHAFRIHDSPHPYARTEMLPSQIVNFFVVSAILALLISLKHFLVQIEASKCYATSKGACGVRNSLLSFFAVIRDALGHLHEL